MEESQSLSLVSRKKESRSLFKKCFKNSMFSLVPFEIWRDLIVSSADLKTIVLLSRTCYAFKEIVDDIGENNLNLALLFRKEEQMELANRYLHRCANNGNATAMFHLAYLYSFSGGFGLSFDTKKAGEWLKKSAEFGSGPGMAFYADFLSSGPLEEVNEELSNFWAKKALLSNSTFAISYCLYYGIGTPLNYKKAFSMLEASAKGGDIDEFGEQWLGFFYEDGIGHEISLEKAFRYYLRSAKQGLCNSQSRVAAMYRFGRGCEKSFENAIIWYKKAVKQGD